MKIINQKKLTNEIYKQQKDKKSIYNFVMFIYCGDKLINWTLSPEEDNSPLLRYIVFEKIEDFNKDNMKKKLDDVIEIYKGMDFKSERFRSAE